MLQYVHVQKHVTICTCTKTQWCYNSKPLLIRPLYTGNCYNNRIYCHLSSLIVHYLSSENISSKFSKNSEKNVSKKVINATKTTVWSHNRHDWTSTCWLIFIITLLIPSLIIIHKSLYKHFIKIPNRMFLEEMFNWYYIHSDVCNKFNCSTTIYCVARHGRVNNEKKSFHFIKEAHTLRREYS